MDPSERILSKPSWQTLITRERWIEIARIFIVGFVTLLYWQEILPLRMLLAPVALGLYPLVKIGLLDLIHSLRHCQRAAVGQTATVGYAGAWIALMSARILSSKE